MRWVLVLGFAVRLWSATEHQWQPVGRCHAVNRAQARCVAEQLKHHGLHAKMVRCRL